MNNIEVGRTYRTATGKRVRVTEFHDWAGVVFYTVLDSEGKIKDFGNATVDQFGTMVNNQSPEKSRDKRH